MQYRYRYVTNKTGKSYVTKYIHNFSAKWYDCKITRYRFFVTYINDYYCSKYDHKNILGKGTNICPEMIYLERGYFSF